MLLSDWLAKNKLRPYAFARMAGFHPSIIYKVLSGERKVGRKLALKIENYTKKEVTRNELMWPEDFQEKNEDGSIQFKMNLEKRSKK